MSSEPKSQSGASPSNSADASSVDSKSSTDMPASAPLRFAKPHRIAFIQSSWHREIVAECRAAFLKEIALKGIQASQVGLFEVPGVYEIPLHAQLLAKTGRYTAIVAAGLVVDAGYRQELVAGAVINALMQVQLQTEIPIFSAVLSPRQFEHDAHFEFFRGQFAIKGAEVAHACAYTLFSLDHLGSQVVAGLD
jgi:6,7-dimethyl-8-ribityllumazine synthase